MKNGLFLISIGLLIFMYAANQNSLNYDFLSLTTAVFLMVTGGIIAYKANKKEKAAKRKEEGA